MPADSYDYEANCRHWPDVVGRFPVGTLEFEVTDTLRSSQYAPEPTVTRRLYVRAWYPAGDVAGHSRRPYFTTAEIDVVPVMSLQLLRQPSDALRHAVRLLTNAWVGAPPVADKFPVAVFNHGYLSYPAQHTALFEHLAANGYAVQNALVGGFLDHHVKDTPTDFPRRVRDAHPDVIVQDLSWLRERARVELN